MSNSKRRREERAATKLAEMGSTKRVTVEFEELGTAIAQRQVASGAITTPIEHEAFQMADQVVHQFRTWIAAGAPRTVTVSASFPKTWYWHLVQDIARNAATKSITNLGTVFGHWLGGKVKTGTISNREDVNRNICPHINRPNHHQKHVQYLLREV